MQDGLAFFQCILSGAEGAAAKHGLEREDHGAVRVANIPPGSREVVAAVRLGEMVPVRNDPILRLPALRTPTTVRNAIRDSPIQTRTIRTGLSTADNFENSKIHFLTYGFPDESNALPHLIASFSTVSSDTTATRIVVRRVR